MDLYISPMGNDKSRGTRPAPGTIANEGPLASFQGALARIRSLKSNGTLDGPVTVYVRGGTYTLEAPLVLRPTDSWPMTFRPYKNEKPVISGGRPIKGWHRRTVNGQTLWTADLPEVKDGTWAFRQLFVNGKRAPRPRLPKKGLRRMADVPGLTLPSGWGEGGYTRFVCSAGDVKAFANLQDVEVVYVHFWIEERSPITAFDAETNLVTMQRPSRAPLLGSHGSQLADYYLDNVREALTEPGEWYLDRAEGRLYYLPREGETLRNTTIVAPVALQLLALVGDPAGQHAVEHIRFEGLTFAHTDWRHPSADGAIIAGASDGSRNGSHSRRHDRGNMAAASQAAADVPGVIAMVGAKHCSIVDCTIENGGWYGVEIGDGCSGIHLVGNTIRRMGGGGVKINGAAARDPDVTLCRTGNHRITDNEISACGRVFHSAVGVLSMHAFNVTIAHNHIHDLYYSGISCGWEWGYQESVSRDNTIEFNHIHDIGHGLLSDMGGIYTLGVQPGTTLRNNLIHGIRSAHYGGWCIYPDEGSSHLVIENNVCYDADRNAFHQHYGRENMIVNNVFALGRDAALTYSRGDGHIGFTMLNNVFISDGVPIFASGYQYALSSCEYRSDSNVLFDMTGKRPRFLDRGKVLRSLTAMRKWGYERHSIVADPGFRSITRRDFRLKKDAAALKVGFKPIDLSTVGPRAETARD